MNKKYDCLFQRRLEATVRQWVSYGSQLLDKDQVEKAIGNFYLSLGFKPPLFVYVDSPIEGVLLSVAIDFFGRIRINAEFKEILESSIRKAKSHPFNTGLDEAVVSRLQPSVQKKGFSNEFVFRLRDLDWKILQKDLEKQIDSREQYFLKETIVETLADAFYQVCESVDAAIEAEVQELLGLGLSSSLANSLKRYARNLLCLDVWKANAAQYEFAKKYLGVAFDDRAYRLFTEVVRQGSFLFLFSELALICERPMLAWQESVVKRGDSLPVRFVLHDTQGSAVLFHDGFEIFVENGKAIL